MSHFVYRPLDPRHNNAIRTISVSRYLRHGVLSCTLRNTTTESCYRTLSYRWGEASGDQQTILLNGVEFLARPNLFQFLHYARRHYPHCELWIDAICIDQRNIDERNSQVQRMWRVYQSCQEVLIWLGRDSRHAKYTLRCLRRFEGMRHSEIILNNWSDDRFWRGCRELAANLYWSRLWVASEVILPSAGRLILDDESATLRALENFVECCTTKFHAFLRFWTFPRYRRDQYGAIWALIKPLIQERQQRSKGASSCQEDLVIDFRSLAVNQCCADTLDRVYGTLPLIEYGPSLKVDYRLDPFQLFLEILWLKAISTAPWRFLAILMLTPTSICYYADAKTCAGRRLASGPDLPIRRAEFEALHRRSASTYVHMVSWLEVADLRDRELWHELSPSKDLSRLSRGLWASPVPASCSQQHHLVTFWRDRCYLLQIAVSRRTSARRRWDEVFPSREDGVYALGTYHTTCTPQPMDVYYVLRRPPSSVESHCKNVRRIARVSTKLSPYLY